MLKVPRTLNLKKLKGVWYYRRRVPKHIQAVIGRSVISKSLQTKDLAVAVKLREQEDVVWSAKFKAVEDGLRTIAALPYSAISGERPVLSRTAAIDIAP